MCFYTIERIYFAVCADLPAVAEQMLAMMTLQIFILITVTDQMAHCLLVRMALCVGTPNLYHDRGEYLYRH